MAQPPPTGPPPVPPLPPAPGGPPYPPYGPYPPPAPSPKSETRTILIVIAVVVVVIAVLAIVAVIVVGNFLRSVGTVRPVIALSTVDVASGNASFSVQAATVPTPCSDFAVRLMVGTSTSTVAPLGCTGAPVSLTAGTTAYLVTWTDVDASGTVSVGDRFAVTGDGVPLPVNQSFVFYLDWTGGGSPTFSGVTSWST